MMLQEVAQHPALVLQLSLRGRSFFLLSIEAGGPLASIERRKKERFSYQIAGGDGVLWFPNGELVGDRSGGSAK